MMDSWLHGSRPAARQLVPLVNRSWLSSRLAWPLLPGCALPKCLLSAVGALRLAALWGRGHSATLWGLPAVFKRPSTGPR